MKRQVLIYKEEAFRVRFRTGRKTFDMDARLTPLESLLWPVAGYLSGEVHGAIGIACGYPNYRRAAGMFNDTSWSLSVDAGVDKREEEG